ncbi:MAG: uridylate kinase [Chloroflexi bacterium]|nr:MAG: uridylate kinase [Chloroflexota bacterium]
MEALVFLKLGGSLITDKRRAETPRREVIARLAREIGEALKAAPDLRLVLGHGAGSFGHWAARQYGTRQGVHTQEEWLGYAKVAAAAARLHRIVADICLEAGLPVVSFQPSASALCWKGTLRTLAIYPIHVVLEHGLIPLVYGDVALDLAQGGTIVSTEELFAHIAQRLRPARILLAGEAAGVYDLQGAVIPTITPADLPALRPALAGSEAPDVTGGMAAKVEAMLALVQAHPGLQVHIFSGREPGLLTQVLLHPDLPVGTHIHA